MTPDDTLLALFRDEMGRLAPVVGARIEALVELGALSPDPDLLDALASIRGAARVVDLGPVEGLVSEIESAVAVALALSAEAMATMRDAAIVLGRMATEPPRRLVTAVESARTRIAKLLEGVTVTAPPVAAIDGTAELFKMECEIHTATLSDGLLVLEREPQRLEIIERIMRAAHSLKGAARVVGLETAVGLAHAMEDVLTAARRDGQEIPPETMEKLLQGTDALAAIGRAGAVDDTPALATLTASIRPARGQEALAPTAVRPAVAPTAEVPGPSDEGERVLRVRAVHISRLVALAGESLVESRRLKPLAQAQHLLRSRQASVSDLVNDLHQALGAPPADDPVGIRVADLRGRVMECRTLLSDWQTEFDVHRRRVEDLVVRTYREATTSRMRPLSDGLGGFPRMVRDVAKRLSKQVDLVMRGQEISIDRDILEKIEAPLNHLLRNAVDHGIESPADRAAAGKSARGTLRLEARHRAGTITVTLSDDGRGIDPERVRQQVIQQGLLPAPEAQLVNEERLYDFLFTPGFSTAESVGEISGRGVGLDVVQNVVHEVGGAIHVASIQGEGTVFTLTLPVSRSVIRAVVVAIGGEAYAFPLARIDRLLAVHHDETRVVEDRQYVIVDERNVALVPAVQMLELDSPILGGPLLHIVVASDRSHRYGFVIERFLGEQDLVVRPLDPRLGRVADISAASILPDGSPVLIIDVDDLIRSVTRLQQVARIEKVTHLPRDAAPTTRRILVVDDSITVRELERQLLETKGYEVETAVDGAHAWDAVRDRPFDLVITDVDMPRMSGITLCRSIKQDPRLRHIPVVIVSYRDSAEDRTRGTEAGADLYFAKAEFQDDTLVGAVRELIGGATV